MGHGRPAPHKSSRWTTLPQTQVSAAWDPLPAPRHPHAPPRDGVQTRGHAESRPDLRQQARVTEGHGAPQLTLA